MALTRLIRRSHGLNRSAVVARQAQRLLFIPMYGGVGVSKLNLFLLIQYLFLVTQYLFLLTQCIDLLIWNRPSYTMGPPSYLQSRPNYTMSYNQAPSTYFSHRHYHAPAYSISSSVYLLLPSTLPCTGLLTIQLLLLTSPSDITMHRLTHYPAPSTNFSHRPYYTVFIECCSASGRWFFVHLCLLESYVIHNYEDIFCFFSM
jgi:hypothetical protein